MDWPRQIDQKLVRIQIAQKRTIAHQNRPCKRPLTWIAAVSVAPELVRLRVGVALVKLVVVIQLRRLGQVSQNILRW
jgi:hypothetical protein